MWKWKRQTKMCFRDGSKDAKASLFDGTRENDFEHERTCLQILIRHGYSARLNPSIRSDRPQLQEPGIQIGNPHHRHHRCRSMLRHLEKRKPAISIVTSRRNQTQACNRHSRYPALILNPTLIISSLAPLIS